MRQIITLEIHHALLPPLDVSPPPDSESENEYNVDSEGDVCLVGEEQINNYDDIAEQFIKIATQFIDCPDEANFDSMNDAENTAAAK